MCLADWVKHTGPVSVQTSPEHLATNVSARPTTRARFLGVLANFGHAKLGVQTFHALGLLHPYEQLIRGSDGR